jgi:hypothetical protein
MSAQPTTSRKKPAGPKKRPSAIAKFRKQFLERRSSIIAFDPSTPAAMCTRTLNLTQRDLRKLKNKFELVDLE